MHRRLYILLIFTILVSPGLKAQGHVIRGTILDEHGVGIPGATIVEVDANDRVVKGAISDINGNYMMEFSSENAIANFSFIGYSTVREPINGRSVINVSMVTDAQELEEVMVVATVSSSSLTGISQRDRTGSSVKVDISEMKNISVTSVDDALQGQVAGLDIISGGNPGSGSSIVIRGLSGLGNSQPLIVVDGIAQKVSTGNIDLSSADTEDIGALVSIAPEDIKSIRVLKDAAETAIWGSQGANGVLEIETRKGKRGKTRFEVNYKKSITIESPTIPLLNGDEYVMLQQEMWHNARGIFELPSEIANDKDNIDYFNYSQNTDWLGEITRTGQIDDFGFRITGGGEKTIFYSSVNYQNNVGTVINTANKRLTTRLNIDYRISKRLSLNTQISYVNIYKDDNWKNKQNGIEYNIRRMAFIKSPNMAIYEHDSKGILTGQYFNPIDSYQGSGELYYNPVAVGNLSSNDRSSNSFQTNFGLRFRANDWLTFRQIVSFQFENAQSSLFLPYTAIGTKWLNANNNFAQERNSSGILLTSRTTALLSLINTSNHFLSGTLLWETSRNSDEYIQTATGNGPSLLITDPAAYSTKYIDPAPNSTKYAIRSNAVNVNSVGGLGQILYKYKDRHIFQASARADANSKFGETFRWGLFPSGSYAWRFSEEDFLKRLGYLGESKLRVSYGRTGRSSLRAYDRHGYYSDAGGSGTYMDLQTIVPVQVELERVKWETVDMFNVGLDLSLFRDRLYMTVEVYDKLTKDMLWPKYNLPSSSGYNSLKQYNEGELRNRGWEFNSKIVAVRKKNLNISLNFNIYNNQNLFMEFPANLITERNTELGNGVYPLKAEAGTPVGSFFGFRYLGVYPTTDDAMARNADGSAKLDANGKPIYMNYNGIYQFEGGDAKYKDINNDGIIDLNDVVYLGDSNPDFAGGIGSNIRYKGFSFYAQFMFRTGFQIVNEIAMDTETLSDRNNQSTATLRRWMRPGQDFPGMLPRAYRNHPANNLGSDRYVENGNYIRLNSLSIGYSFGRNVLQRLHLNKLEVFFIGRRLLTFTNYTGQDPEIRNIIKDPFWFGTDSGLAPPPSVYAFNFLIGF
ncbi:MAG TPA: SusC/RagA family TonB-linked outer membrane protein [Bacteroides sp.]|nr:SusC/RagA family TonB-linked outer membrane protein [Bacteroides sp.]